MLLPGGLPEVLLLLVTLGLFMAAPLLSLARRLVLTLQLLLPSMLCPAVLVRSLLLLGMLLLLALIGLLLSSLLRPAVLVRPLLLLGMLLLLVLLLSLRLLSVLLFGSGGLTLVASLFGMILLLALLFVLSKSRYGDSEKQSQKSRARNSDHFHKCCLRLHSGCVGSP